MKLKWINNAIYGEHIVRWAGQVLRKPRRLSLSLSLSLFLLALIKRFYLVLTVPKPIWTIWVLETSQILWTIPLQHYLHTDHPKKCFNAFKASSRASVASLVDGFETIEFCELLRSSRERIIIFSLQKTFFHEVLLSIEYKRLSEAPGRESARIDRVDIDF